MKFTTNYDIMERIRCAKEGLTVWDYYKLIAKYSPGVAILVSGIVVEDFYDAISFLAENRISKNDVSVIDFYFGIGGCVLWIFGHVVIVIITKISKKGIMQEASYNLNELVSNLYDLEVKTSEELLKKSTVIQTKYKLTYKDDCGKIPKLKQEKYINVPLTNGYEKTILQEHVFGDKNYEISVQSPVKKYKFKLAKTNT